ncbi:hypothetical protein Barb6_01769 [Bacteroidales bacterium Barb6]|nr:hypothetical protein Barb6_01769 [Bacteroidales bacterium Barb6]
MKEPKYVTKEELEKRKATFEYFKSIADFEV